MIINLCSLAILCRKPECNKVSVMVQALRLIATDLAENELSGLDPNLTLAGSVAEGTCLQQANEMDVTLTFDSLNTMPFGINSCNACELLLPEVAGGTGHSLLDFCTTASDEK